MGQLYSWGTHLPPASLYGFIVLWLFVESTGFPISDEPLLLLSGYLSTTGQLAFTLVVGLALLGKVAASCAAYWVGTRIPLERLARAEAPSSGARGGWPGSLRPTRATLRTVEERFRRHGAWGVFVGRLIPVVRSFISYPAGAAGMPFHIFFIATTAGSLLWIVVWTSLGATVGRSYLAVEARWGNVSWLIVLAAVVALGLFWLWQARRERVRRVRHAQQKEAEERAAQATDTLPQP